MYSKSISSISLISRYRKSIIRKTLNLFCGTVRAAAEQIPQKFTIKPNIPRGLLLLPLTCVCLNPCRCTSRTPRSPPPHTTNQALPHTSQAASPAPGRAAEDRPEPRLLVQRHHLVGDADVPPVHEQPRRQWHVAVPPKEQRMELAPAHRNQLESLRSGPVRRKFGRN